MIGRYPLSMVASEGLTGRQASAPLGRKSTLFLAAFCLVLCFGGPVFATVAVFSGRAGEGICLSITTVPFGLIILSAMFRSRSDTRQLSAAGVPATAEVLSIESEEDVVSARLRVSAPETGTFDATYKFSAAPGLSVGDQLEAIVDPSDRLFSIS